MHDEQENNNNKTKLNANLLWSVMINTIMNNGENPVGCKTPLSPSY